MLLPVMEGTVSLAGATRTESSGILWSARKRAGFLLILFNYLDCRCRTGRTFNPKAFRGLHGAGLQRQASPEVQVSFRILHVQWSKVTMKWCRRCVLHPATSKPMLYLAYMLVGAVFITLCYHSVSPQGRKGHPCHCMEIVCCSGAACV